MASRLLSKIPTHVKELRLHLCQTSAASQGVRDFIETCYVDLKKQNPKFPILIRECSGVTPKAYARYGFGKEASVSLDGMSKTEVEATLHKLTN